MLAFPLFILLNPNSAFGGGIPLLIGVNGQGKVR